MNVPSAEVIKAHRSNLARYYQLLTTDLTEVEREFILRRVAETRTALESLSQENSRIHMTVSA